MKNLIRITIYSLILGGLVFACYNQVSDKETETAQQQAKKVQTAQANPIDYRESVFASGKLSSKEEARLSFKTGGIIKRIHVREGQTVNKGQLLAELDLQEINAKNRQAALGKQQSEITIENAKLALQLAERDYRNAQGLYKDSVATLEQLENAEVQFNNAKNQLEAAKTGLDFSERSIDVANFNLKYARILAPSKGIILKKVAESNELVGPGTPVILFGSKAKAQVVKVNITDKDIINIELNNEANIQFDAYPEHTFKGYVREIASMADPYTNTFEIEIEVAAEDKKLLSGFIAAVNIFTNAEERLFKIPVDALIGADKKSGSVFVVDKGKALKTRVGIYKIDGETLLINKGLTDQDEIIISGVGYLEDNDSVLISKK